MNKCKISIILLLFILPELSFSTMLKDTLTIPVDLIGAKQGLSQGFVMSIIQDHDGYMWFASKDGLNRWDGYHMTVFRNIKGDETSLQDNNITSLFEDELGRFWVGTATKGVFLFDKKTNRFYPFCNQNTKEATIIGIKYRNNQLLVEAHENLILYDVSKIKPNNFTPENLKNHQQILNLNQLLKPFSRSVSLNIIWQQIWLRDNRFIIGLSDKIFVLSPSAAVNKWTVDSLPPSYFGVNSDHIYRLYLPNSGDEFFAACGDQLHILSSKTLKKKITKTFEIDPFKDIHFSSLTKDKIIFGDFNRMYLYNQSTHTIQPLRFSQNGKIFPINEPFIDKNGISWVGTSSAIGVIRYDPFKSAFHNYPYEANNYSLIDENFLLAPHVYNTYLINIHSGSRNEIMNVNPYLLVRGISSGSADGENIYTINYVVKTQEQLFVCYNTTTGKQITAKVPDSENILSIFFDTNRRLWAVVAQPDNSRWMVEFDKVNLKATRRFKFPGIQNNNYFTFVSAWLSAGNGKLWLGTLQGLFLFNPDAASKNEIWKHWQSNVNKEATLSENMIFSLGADPLSPSNKLWVGTNGGGLNSFDIASGKFKSFTTADGLPNNVVYGILPDNQGNVWISTNNGLCRFNVTNYSVRNYSEEDGLPNNEFNRYLYCKASESKFIFGGINGMTIFNPAEINQKKAAANILLTGLSLFNKPVDFNHQPEILDVPVQYASIIHIPAGVSMFSLEFAVMDNLATHQKTYKYKLEGFDKDWINSGAGNVATYTNIAPGTYTFHATGTNSDGVWCLSPAKIKIVVLPEWWQTWWFKLVAMLVFSGLIYGFYRYRLRQVLKLQSMRNNIANDLHDEIGSTLSSISLYGESARKLIPQENPAQNILHQITSNTTSMLESMSDIVWAINTRNDQFDNLLNRMNAFTYEIMEPRGINVHFQITAGEKLKTFQMEERKNIYLLFKEVLNNAAKHSGCKNVWVTAGLENGKFHLEIRDDGKGFHYDKESGHSSRNFGGNGLHNIKKRANALNATLIIDSKIGSGTSIKLKMRK